MQPFLQTVCCLGAMWKKLYDVKKHEAVKFSPQDLTGDFFTMKLNNSATYLYFCRSGKGGHVAHLKFHPEEYKQAVKQLLSLTSPP